MQDHFKLKNLNYAPFPVSETPLEKQEPHSYWTPTQIEEMLTASKDIDMRGRKLLLAGHLLYEMGCRSEDLLVLKYKDFTRESAFLNHTYNLTFRSGK